MRKLSIAVIAVVVFFLLPSTAWAATFYLEPQTGSFNAGDTLSVKLYIDTQGQEIFSADAVFLYDPNILQFERAEVGAFFSNIFPYNDAAAGKLRIGGFNSLAPDDPANNPPGSKVNGQGLMATLLFKALAGGPARLAFSCNTDFRVFCCTNEEIEAGSCDNSRFCSDSGIYNPETGGIRNYLDCSSLVDGQYTIIGNDGGDGNPTPTFPLDTPVPGTPTCDQCGYCGGGDYPPNYEACQACISQSGKAWTVIGCVPTTASGFVQAVLSFLMPLAGGLAFLGIIYGGFFLLTSSGDPLRISHGKSILMGSVGALLLILFSVYLLKLVGFEILKIPGLG